MEIPTSAAGVSLKITAKTGIVALTGRPGRRTRKSDLQRSTTTDDEPAFPVRGWTSKERGGCTRAHESSAVRPGVAGVVPRARPRYFAAIISFYGHERSGEGKKKPINIIRARAERQTRARDGAGKRLKPARFREDKRNSRGSSLSVVRCRRLSTRRSFVF